MTLKICAIRFRMRPVDGSVR